jgi:hypothetical protein
MGIFLGPPLTEREKDELFMQSSCSSLMSSRSLDALGVFEDLRGFQDRKHFYCV